MRTHHRRDHAVVVAASAWRRCWTAVGVSDVGGKGSGRGWTAVAAWARTALQHGSGVRAASVY
jgi:hypothetical protein